MHRVPSGLNEDDFVSDSEFNNLVARLANMSPGIATSTPSRSRRGYTHYVVTNGRRNGIYQTWFEAHGQVDQYPSASFQGFRSEREAQAYWSNFLERQRLAIATQLQQPESRTQQQQTRTQPQQPRTQPQQPRTIQQQQPRTQPQQQRTQQQPRTGHEQAGASPANRGRREVHREIPSCNGATRHQVLVYYDDFEPIQPEHSLGQSSSGFPPPYSAVSSSDIDPPYFVVSEGQHPGVYESYADAIQAMGRFEGSFRGFFDQNEAYRYFTHQIMQPH